MPACAKIPILIGVAMMFAVLLPFQATAQSAVTSPGEKTKAEVVGPQAASGVCKVGAVRYKAQSGQQQTQSTDFVAIPGMATKFKLAGTKPGCVVVTFTTETAIASGEVMRVRAVMLGVIPPVPVEYIVTGTNGVNGLTFETHSMQFVFTDVPVGKRKVIIEYESVGGAFVYVSQRLLTIQYGG